LLLRGPWQKTLWVLVQGFAYGLRPLFVHPKKPDRWEVANIVVQLAFDALLFHFWGLRSLLYLPISSLVVMGLHPLAGHYISEHYAFRDDQETYSYYGPLNRLTFNVGHHNEHHDFPYIPGSRLARVRQIAPEYYDGLMHHTSWISTIWQYITSPEMSAHRRVMRAGRAADPS
jgi:sphingolipid delta-4 desaturase